MLVVCGIDIRPNVLLNVSQAAAKRRCFVTNRICVVSAVVSDRPLDRSIPLAVEQELHGVQSRPEGWLREPSSALWSLSSGPSTTQGSFQFRAGPVGCHVH